jgi:hypothetical protein
MRLNSWLLILITLAALVFAAANWNTLFKAGTVNLFFLGDYVLPTRLLGLLSLVLLAVVFTLLSGLQDTQARARSAEYLRRIEELRVSLDRQEASRFATLQNQLTSATRQILEEIRGSRTSVSEPSGGRTI